MKRIYPRFNSVIYSALSLVLSFARMEGCGVNWAMPQDHFNGVNEYGAVSYWDSLGTMDLGDGLQIPLVIGFQSDREQSSPYLGKGWILALLDSNIVQVDENNFTMVQPTGWTVNFWRAHTTDTVLGGQGGWQAQIDGDAITAWAECGWRLTYTKGKLTSIGTPQNKSLDFVYQGGKVGRIMYGAEDILDVTTDASTGAVTGLRFKGQQVKLEQGKRPMVQVINGRSLIGSIEQSLEKITFSDGSTRTYKTAIDAKLQPTLKIDDRLITWDASSKHILQDGEWKYKITPNDPGNARIERTSKTGQTELWFFNPFTGEDITKNAYGPEIDTQFFTSGILNGKLRRIVQKSVDGIAVITKQVDYNESALPIREMEYNPVTQNKKEFFFSYLPDNSTKITLLEGGATIERTYNSNGIVTQSSDAYETASK